MGETRRPFSSQVHGGKSHGGGSSSGWRRRRLRLGRGGRGYAAGVSGGGGRGGFGSETSSPAVLCRIMATVGGVARRCAPTAGCTSLTRTRILHSITANMKKSTRTPCGLDAVRALTSSICLYPVSIPRLSEYRATSVSPSLAA